MGEEWDVYQMLPGTDVPVLVATLYEASQKTIRVELDGAGSGSFAVNRSSPECTEAILARGNLVRVRIPEIHTDYIFAFFLETGDFTLISSQEEGGEMLSFGGRGNLSYGEYGRAWSHSYITGGDDPIAGVWRAYNAGTGNKPGQILRRLLEEFQDPDRPQQPIPLLTIDFDYDNDSTTDPWDDSPATDEFSYQVGEDGFAIIQRLLETKTLTVQIDPDFLLHAYNRANFGRDLSGTAFGAGVVRFERGVNIATELRRQWAAGGSSLGGGSGVPDTHMLAQGEADKYGTAALTDATTRVTKEGFIAAFGTGTTALNGIAGVELVTRLGRSDEIMFPIANRRTSDVVLSDPVSVGASLGALAAAGFYLPGPEGTSGDFWVGDTVRVHTGSGPFDYNEVDALVTAITIARDDDNAELTVIPELLTQLLVPPVLTDAYLLSVIAQRSASGGGSGIVPRGWAVCNTDSPLTSWTYLDDAAAGGNPGEYEMTAAYRTPASSGEPLINSWGGDSGLNGAARPEVYSVQISGATGPPVVLGNGGGVLSLPFLGTAVSCPEAGWLFAIYSNSAGKSPGDDGHTYNYVPVTAGVVEIDQSFAFGGFAPKSWFGYVPVMAGLGSIELTSSGDSPSDGEHGWGWIYIFVPGTDLASVDYVPAEAAGSTVCWTWGVAP